MEDQSDDNDDGQKWKWGRQNFVGLKNEWESWFHIDKVMYFEKRDL